MTIRQRIDLFGARKQDLPDIWEDLVEAGFESGHAYGNHPKLDLDSVKLEAFLFIRKSPAYRQVLCRNHMV